MQTTRRKWMGAIAAAILTGESFLGVARAQDCRHIPEPKPKPASGTSLMFRRDDGTYVELGRIRDLKLALKEGEKLGLQPGPLRLLPDGKYTIELTNVKIDTRGWVCSQGSNGG